ncbi:MAG: dockerin type I repeat-containing protein [Planctomycetota bacterium]
MMDSKATNLLAGEDYAGLLIDRLATTIVDDSLPLKEVEKELRGCVADVAVHRRGLAKRETASRCGVTETSIENYRKEVRPNPKSPEREIARVLQDSMLSLEEVHAAVFQTLASSRNFTLDDAKRALEKLIRTGEVQEYPGHKYRAVERPSIRYPETVEAHRQLVDQKARDLDYIVLKQKEAEEDEVLRKPGQRFSRVVGDTSLVRVDFTVDVDPENLPEFYEELSKGIAKITMKHEKKRGKSRVRLLLGMRSVVASLLIAFFLLIPKLSGDEGDGGASTSWELDDVILRDSGDGPADSAAATSFGLIRRGDVDLDLNIGITDAVILTKYMAGEILELPCARTADVNQDQRVNFVDAILLIEVLYRGSGGSAMIDFGDVDLTVSSPLPCLAL